MDNFPNSHSFFSSSWVFITNLMEILQLVIVASSLYRGKYKDSRYLLFKCFLSCLSCLGMINFLILGSYVPCHCTSSVSGSYVAVMMRMEECLQIYSEDFCFSIQKKQRYQDSACRCSDSFIVVTLRKYNHCPLLHPIRGFGEVAIMDGLNGSLSRWSARCFI